MSYDKNITNAGFGYFIYLTDLIKLRKRILLTRSEYFYFVFLMLLHQNVYSKFNNTI